MMDRLLGLGDKVRVEKVDSNFFRTEYFAPRPRSERLINVKLNREKMNVMRDWRVCLEEYSQVFRGDLKARMS
jgi:dTDP-4-dehydrorhamnose reductase